MRLAEIEVTNLLMERSYTSGQYALITDELRKYGYKGPAVRGDRQTIYQNTHLFVSSLNSKALASLLVFLRWV